MWKYKIKELFSRPTFAAGFTFVITIGLILALTLPFMNSSSYKGNIIAYTRDSHSGAREVFLDSIDFEYGDQKLSRNVIETGSSASMEIDVLRNDEAIGYSSASQFIKYSAIDSDEYNEAVEDGNQELIDSLREEMLVENNARNSEPIILNLNDVDPFDKIGLMDDDSTYKAKRTFNKFWRQPKSESDNWTFDPSTGIFEVPNDANDNEKLSWAFFNYLDYSEEVVEVIQLSTSTKEISFVDDVNWDSLEISSSNSLTIETVGSTSVIPALQNSLTDDENGFNKIAIDSLDITQVTHSESHTGSGDAFKGTKGHIGFQSRMLKSGDLITDEVDWEWSYEDLIDDEATNKDKYKTPYYFGYETDALVYFVSEKNPLYSNEDIDSNITSKILNNIYTSGKLDWEELEYLLN